ncbi:MAG: molybdopterin-binding protein [Desulfurococcaceae archaeon]
MEGKEEPLCLKVVVVSDRVAEGSLTDVSGELAVKALSGKGVCVSGKVVARNSYRELMKVLRSSRERVLLFLGGTGPSPRDITVDVVENVAWRCLPGFGELYRYMSYQRIGINAILTRTTLCILHDGKVAVVLPGSPDAVALGVELLSQVINHLVEEVDRFEAPHGDLPEGR